MDVAASLAEEVLEARRRGNLTQEQFAVLAGITAKTLRSIEAGMDSERLQTRTIKGVRFAIRKVGSPGIGHGPDGTPGAPAQAENHERPDSHTLAGDDVRAGAAQGG